MVNLSEKLKPIQNKGKEVKLDETNLQSKDIKKSKKDKYQQHCEEMVVYDTDLKQKKLEYSKMYLEYVNLNDKMDQSKINAKSLKEITFSKEKSYFNVALGSQQLRRGLFFGELKFKQNFKLDPPNLKELNFKKIEQSSKSKHQPISFVKNMKKKLEIRNNLLQNLLKASLPNYLKNRHIKDSFNEIDVQQMHIKCSQLLNIALTENQHILNKFTSAQVFDTQKDQLNDKIEIQCGMSPEIDYEKQKQEKHCNFEFLEEKDIKLLVNMILNDNYCRKDLKKLINIVETLPQIVIYDNLVKFDDENVREYWNKQIHQNQDVFSSNYIKPQNNEEAIIKLVNLCMQHNINQSITIEGQEGTYLFNIQSYFDNQYIVQNEKLQFSNQKYQFKYNAPQKQSIKEQIKFVQNEETLRDNMDEKYIEKNNPVLFLELENLDKQKIWLKPTFWENQVLIKPRADNHNLLVQEQSMQKIFWSSIKMQQNLYEIFQIALNANKDEFIQHIKAKARDFLIDYIKTTDFVQHQSLLTYYELVLKLQFIKLREKIINLLNSLNGFRSLQKQITLQLNQNQNPIKFPQNQPSQPLEQKIMPDKLNLYNLFQTGFQEKNVVGCNPSMAVYGSINSNKQMYDYHVDPSQISIFDILEGKLIIYLCVIQMLLYYYHKQLIIIIF